MASSSDIGANFDNYTGNAQLGGAGLGAFDIDTKPLQQLAQYTFFYNRSKWEQKQKDLEANAKEYASLTDYDLTNSIPKFSKEIQQKYNDLYSYVQANPTVMDYKNNQKGWLEYRKMKQDFETDLLNAKSQDAIFKSGQAVIEKETRPEVKAYLQKQLEDEVASKDLKTPIRLQQYEAEPTVLPSVPIRKFDIIRRDAKGDMIIDREIEVADQKAINNIAGGIALGLQRELLDVNSAAFKQLPPDVQAFKIDESKKRKATGRQAVVDEAQIFTAALQHFKDPATGKIDIDKVAASNPIIAGSLKAIIDYNKLMDDEVAKIRSGFYSDNLGVLKFGVNGVDEKDYQKIDYSDGEITATDLLKVQLRAKAPQPSYKTEAKELNNANDLIKAGMIQSGENYRARLSQGGENYRKELELIGKGWTKDAKGKLQPPKANATTSTANGGIVPYWQNYILPQIINAKGGLQTTTKEAGWFTDAVKETISKDFTGDAEVSPDKISGLGVALLDEKTSEGKQKGITGVGDSDEKTKISIRFDKGNPIGVVIDGVFYDQNDINSKATRMQDKTMTNKQDANIFGTTEQPQPTPTTGGMTDEEYKAFLKKNGLK